MTRPHPLLLLPKWSPLLVPSLGACIATLVLFNRSVELDLLAASAMALLAVLVGVLRQWQNNGQVDPMSPIGFPLVYVALSTLMPAWLILVSSEALMGFPPKAYGSSSACLLALSVIGFAVGVHLGPRRPSKRSDMKAAPPLDDLRTWRRLRALGRIMLVLLVVFAIVNLLTGGVKTRTLAQSTYQLTDSVRAAALIAVVPAVVLVLVCAGRLPRGTVPIDYLLIGCVIVSSAANGGRAAAIEALVTVTFFLTRRRTSMKFAAGALGVILAFALIVLVYRQHQLGNENHDAFTSIATDLSPVSYTVGLVDAHVPADLSYQHGLTFAVAAVRQLPYFLTEPVFGSPQHTGNELFRSEILRQTDANSGYGFSLPAEGLLNWGVVGVLLVPLLVGWLLAWAYPRASTRSLRPSACLYVVATATLPFAYRSDAVGAIKGVLYPALFLWILCLGAEWLARRSDSAANQSADKEHRPRSGDAPAR